jgi:Aerotolerance regulator N-terminal
MSFGALAAWQAWLLLAGAVAVAAAIFRIKVRPPRVEVPSLLLWRRVLDQVRAVSWWERVRRAVSLAVTVLIAAALALAIARPVPRAAAAGGGRRLIVLDSSWSMRARTADGRTRWAHAVAEARELAGGAGGRAVALATTAGGLVEGPTTDTALIESALDRLAPSGGSSAAWPHVSGTGAVHFITDGAIARALDPDVTVHSVFEPAPNVAITALAVRPLASEAGASEAYVEIANDAADAQRVHLALRRGAASVLDRVFAMNAGELIRQVVPLAADGDARLEARVSAPADALDVDDTAVAWIRGAEPLPVTVVSDHPGPFVALLQHAPGIHATFVSTSAYRPATGGVVVFDRWLPPGPPARPALCVTPPSASWLGSVAAAESRPRWTSAGAHPVLAGVDPLTLTIEQAERYQGQGIVPIAKSDRGTPLVSIVDRPDRRLVLLAFGPGNSNLAFAPAFPVLVGNALDWLGRPVDGLADELGLVTLPGSGTTVTGPDGRSVPVVPFGGDAIARLAAPGFYHVAAGGSRSVVAVNAMDPVASNLLRTTRLPAGGAAPARAVAPGHAWWMVVVLLAFALVSVEWWTWQRRITV